MQMSGQQAQRLNQLAFANPLLKTPVTGLVRRILRWHLGPLRAAAQYPEHTVQHCPRIVPRTAAIILTPGWTQDRLHQLPLFVCQFPTTCHAIRRDALSNSSLADIQQQNIYEMGSSLPRVECPGRRTPQRRSQPSTPQCPARRNLVPAESSPAASAGMHPSPASDTA